MTGKQYPSHDIVTGNLFPSHDTLAIEKFDSLGGVSKHTDAKKSWDDDGVTF